jgi:hypothetical protein
MYVKLSGYGRLKAMLTGLIQLFFVYDLGESDTSIGLRKKQIIKECYE